MKYSHPQAMLYSVSNCNRGSKCSIRSHHHDISLSEYFGLPEYFIKINMKYVFNNKKFIDLYEGLLTEKVSEKRKHTIIIKDILYAIETVHIEFRQLLSVFLFHVLMTDVYVEYRGVNPGFNVAVKNKCKEFVDWETAVQWPVFADYMSKNFLSKI